MSATCPKCRSGRRSYVSLADGFAVVCAACGTLLPGDPAKVHGLLNGSAGTRQANVCAICTKPVKDAEVCSGCLDGVVEKLRLVPWLEQQLDIVISRQESREKADGGRSAGSPMPVNLDASDCRMALRHILVSWTLLASEERGIDKLGYRTALGYAPADCPVDTLKAISAWLIGHAEWFRHHGAAVEFVDEVMSAILEAEWYAEAASARVARSVKVGPCRIEGCEGDLWAVAPNGYTGQATVKCRTCGTVDNDWTRFERPLHPAWISMNEAAERLGRSTSLVRKLVALGRITEQRFSARRRLVRHVDVVREAATRENL